MIQIDLPKDCQDYVNDYQHQVKKDKGVRQYSQQHAIYAIIREHKELREQLTACQQEIDQLKEELEKLRRTVQA